MNIIEMLAKEFGLKQSQVEQTVNLIDEGNTIPFIARYRKEATCGMSDVVLRDLDERLTYLRNLEERKEEVIRLIEEQDKLTDELAEEIRKAEVLQRVEDPVSYTHLDVYKRQEHGKLIENAIEFDHLTAEDVMTPRPKIEAVEMDCPLDELAGIFRRTGLSRLPVYEEDIDRIIGVINQKDFHNYLAWTGKNLRCV